MTLLKSAKQILLLFVLCLAFAGCSTESAVSIADRQWANGQLRFIVNSRHYKRENSSLGGGSSRMTGQEWKLITYSFPKRAGQSSTSREFLRMRGESYTWFLSIGGSDLMIHENGSVGRYTERQFTLFDPNTGTDISNPFPPKPAPRVFNRSRTACLTLKEGKAVVYDTLSIGSDEPKVWERPKWTEALKRTIYPGWIKPVLTEDAQHLVLLPWIDAGFFLYVTNFNVQVLSTNGAVASWPLIASWPVPLEKMSQRFLDAETIDKQIRILWSNNDCGTNELRLLNAEGETVRSIKTTAYVGEDVVWNPQSQNVLFPTLGDYSIWNYSLNAMQTGRLH